MKYILAATFILFAATAYAGPKFQFNFGVDRYPYRYYEPAPPVVHGYYDEYGYFHPYAVRPPVRPYREYRGNYYGPSLDLRFRGR